MPQANKGTDGPTTPANGVDRIIAGSLVVIALVVVLRETGVIGGENPPPPPTPPGLTATPLDAGVWDSLWAAAEVHGSSGAPIRVLEFGDFECVYCRSFNRMASPQLRGGSNEIAVGFLHFPLSNHRFARPAAMAAECAREEGRFWEMHDHLYESQDSLGLTPWSRLAAQAGVADTVRFTACLGNPEADRRISEGQRLGDKAGVQATPTIVINGGVLSRPPTSVELDSIIRGAR